ENFFGRIKAQRRISTRYDKLAHTFLGFVQLAAIIDWLFHRF
ncbi:MAG: IS5/IS1182 family transposase, partial [Cephaloticoccus sp.]|nr:IS5/IS1182 family transposase [Cephaloticoccus sp.]